MTESLWPSLRVGLDALLDAAVLLSLLFVGRVFYWISTRVKADDEIAGKDNVALGVALAGYLAGVALAVSGVLLTIGDAPQKALSIALLGCLSIVLLRVSLWLNDKCILGKFSNLKEIVEDRNVGVGFVEAGGCIATGLMIGGVATGPSDSVLNKLLEVTVYWAVGQALMIAGAQGFRLACFRSIDTELERDNNAAAGLSFGGFLVGVGLILHAAFHGVTGNFTPELVTVGIFAGLGLLLLILGGVIFNRILLPRRRIEVEICRDGNLGAGALAAAGFFCLGLFFSAAVAPATTQATFAAHASSEEEAPLPEPAAAAEPAPADAPSAPTH